MLIRFFVSRPDAVVGGLLLVGLIAFYSAVQRGTTPTYDATIYLEVAKNLYEHGSLRVYDDPYLVNTPYASYGLGLSIMILPLVALQQAWRHDAEGVVLLANVFAMAAIALLLYRLARWSGFRRVGSSATALVFGLTTMAVQQSTDLFSEPGVALWMVLTLLGLVRWRSGRPGGALLAGLGIGLAVFFRSDSLVMSTAVLVTVPLFVGSGRLRRQPLQWLLPLALPIAAAVTYQLAYNQFRYGKLTQFGYAGYGFTTPFLTGLYGNVLSPGKGFFVYNLLLVLGVPGLVLLWKRDRALGAAILVLVVARPLFYASWVAWGGGVGWGPRFMFPLCALLALPTVETVRFIASLRSRWRLVALSGVWLMAVVSAFVALLGVLVPFERWWYIVTGNDPAVPQSPELSAHRRHDFFWTFSGNHVAGNLRLLDRADLRPLKWFTGGRTWVGVLLVLISAAALVLALLAARAADRRDRAGPPSAPDSEAQRSPGDVPASVAQGPGHPEERL